MTNPKDPQTKPTIETVLERLQDFRTSVETRLTNMEAHITNMETRMANMEARMTSIETRITSVEARLDQIQKDVHLTNRKFDDWLIDFATVRGRVGLLESRVDRLEVNPATETQQLK